MHGVEEREMLLKELENYTVFHELSRIHELSGLGDIELPHCHLFC